MSAPTVCRHRPRPGAWIDRYGYAPCRECGELAPMPDWQPGEQAPQDVVERRPAPARRGPSRVAIPPRGAASPMPYAGDEPASAQWLDDDGTVHGGPALAEHIRDDPYAGVPPLGERSENGESPPDPAEDTLPGRIVVELYPVLDWHAAFAAQPVDVAWLVEPVIERGKSYAMYAPAKAGKSLLLQDLAAGVATGRPVLGNPAAAPIRVLYVDLENAVTDVVERMSAYGHRPGDLANLRYLSFPALPPLDTRTGGAHLVALANHHGAELVVIDTVSRLIAGAENDADTLHAVYRLALAPLKAAGIAVVRLDHAGKDLARGQRGTSAKSGDVDVVWRLEVAGPTGVTLTREATRNTHHPERVHLVRRFEPLRHELAAVAAMAVGTIAAVAELDALDVPPDAGRDLCRAVLAKAGVRVSNDTLNAAIRHRKNRLAEVPE